MDGTEGVDGIAGAFEKSTSNVGSEKRNSPMDTIDFFLSRPYSCAAAGGLG